MKLERTKNGIRNICWGIINRVVMTLFPFLLRTILIKTLGSEYLGLSSLFTSILTVLNLAELGFSNAIVFCMYKPIAEQDTEMVCLLMGYYRKVYRVIGLVVTVVGLLLIPFLPRLVSGSYPADINVTVLYLLFLANTVVSYFLFAYKSCIITAYQRQDIASKVNLVLKSVMYILQAVSLLVYRNYYLYTALMIVNTCLTNVITAYFSERLYPQYKCKDGLGSKEKSVIREKIQGLMIGKLCMVSRNSFDNIFLSAFLGLETVAIYGNYYYIMNAVIGFLTILMTSLGAGIGNSVATETVGKNYQDMNKFTFIYAWIGGWCTVCLFCLYQPFMALWMGTDMMFPLLDVVLICLYFYALTMGDVRSQYSSAAGLFWENRHYVLMEAACNIILNYILGKYFGVHGIILATLLSIFFINFIWGSQIIFRYYFKQFHVASYIFRHLLYFGVVIIITAMTYAIVVNIPGEGFTAFLLKCIICCIVPNILLYLIYHRSSMFKDSMLFVKKCVTMVKH